jgi:hypothetical protein
MKNPMSEARHPAGPSPTDDTVPAPPHFEINRSWSNRKLTDPTTIIALVLARPTTHDLAQTILTYGLEKVAAVKAEFEPQLPPFRREYLARIWEPVLEGLERAQLQRTA